MKILHRTKKTTRTKSGSKGQAKARKTRASWSPYFNASNTTTKLKIWSSILRNRVRWTAKRAVHGIGVVVILLVATWGGLKLYDEARVNFDWPEGLIPAALDTSQAASTPFLSDIKPITSNEGFTHPGVFVSLPQLAYVREKLGAKSEPYTTIFKQLRKSQYAGRHAPDFKSFASASVFPSDNSADYERRSCSTNDSSGCMTYCGPYQSPNIGCDEIREDGKAVYGQALLYYYTGEKKFAQRAIKILNAYAAHFKGNAGATAHLVSSWGMDMMVRGAEIVRYTYQPTGSDLRFDVEKFSSMLRLQRVGGMLANIDRGAADGNWKLSGANALMSIAVFLDDRDMYNKALSMLDERIVSYIYDAEADGALPKAPENQKGMYQNKTSLSCYWLANKARECQTNPQTDPKLVFQDGQAQESCRDFGHTQLGFGALIAGAETAYHQGTDLFKSHQRRIRKGVTYLVQIELNYEKQGWPANFCNGLVTAKLGKKTANWNSEVVYNAMTTRNGVYFSRMYIPGYSYNQANRDIMKDFIVERKQDKINAEENVSAWETLTHRGVGAGLLTTSSNKR